MDFDLDVKLRREELVNEGKVRGGAAESDMRAELILRLDNIRPHLKDIQFHYNRTSFPKIEDWGWADVDFPGDGVRFEIKWRIHAPKGLSPRFKSFRTDCYVDGIDVSIKHAAQHELLDRFVARVFASSLSDRIEREVEKALDMFAIKVSETMNDIFSGRTQLIPSVISDNIPPILSLGFPGAT